MPFSRKGAMFLDLMSYNVTHLAPGGFADCIPYVVCGLFDLHMHEGSSTGLIRSRHGCIAEDINLPRTPVWGVVLGWTVWLLCRWICQNLCLRAQRCASGSVHRAAAVEK